MSMTIKEQRKKLEESREKLIEASKPLLKYINENHHPMTKIIITSNTVEVVEGAIALTNNEFLKD